MTARTGRRDLETRLAAVEADGHVGLRSLAAGIRNDQQAVINGLTLHWNSGKVEGTVNKIKMIKRQMYGCAASTCSVNVSSCTLRNWYHKTCGRTNFSDHGVVTGG